MKYVNRQLKGMHGYIRKQLIFEIIKTLIMFAMAFGIFFIGYKTLGTKRSLWSVLAVLALLPASKSLVGVIMFARFRSLSDEEYTAFSDKIGELPVVYENILTTTARTFFVPVICCFSSDLIAYTQNDAGEVKAHIESVMATAGHKVSVKVFNDKQAFCKRAEAMRESLKDDNGSAAVLETIKAVSL